MKINKILVPTDFSQEANRALEVAAHIARKTSASITLMHVIDIPVVAHTDSYSVVGQTIADPDPTAYKTYTHKLTEQARQQMDRLKGEYADLELEEKIVFDSFSKHLADFVPKDKIDLVVIGSKGASGMKEVLVGSNAERVIRTAKAPVLTVKDGVDPSFKRIVFASDFKRVSTKAVEVIKYFVELFEMDLHLLKVVTANTFETTPETHVLINGFAKKNGIKKYEGHAYNYYSEEEGIRAFCEGVDAELLALTTHGRRGLSHFFLGSIAEEVTNHSTIPVLTFNEHYRD